MLLTREIYLDQIRPFYESDLIKVITGVRRAGKSVLLSSIRNELLDRGIREDHIVYINLEDIDFEYIQDASSLNSEIKSRLAGDGRHYVFLDEVQHVPRFEKALASLLATENISIFATGSCSTLLSGELATLLTGRTVEFEILPFSFYEVMLYFKLNGKEWDEETMFWNYLKYGGFPLRFDYKDETAILRYVSGLYQSIISRDIIGKSVGYDKSRFRDIALYILANAGKELSVDNVVASYSKSGGRQVSPRTVYNYLDRMKKAFLIHGVGSYNLSGKAALRSREKQYAVDTGFRTVSTNTVNIETSFFLENIVYNELLTRGFSVFTGRTYRGEIDFVAVKNGKKCFIQVAYVLANEETLEREFGAYRKIADASPKYVLSLDKPDLSRNGVAHLNLLDFLLRRKDLYLT